MTEESKEKRKKKHKKNEVSDVGISETKLGGSDVRIEGREHLDKEDMKETTKNDKRSRKERKNDKEKEKEKKKKNDKEKEKEKKNDKEKGKEKEKKKKNDKELEKERSSPKEKKPINDSCKGSVERKKADEKEEVRILNMDDRAGNANEKLENKKRKRVKDNGHLNVSNICDNVNQQHKEVETVQSVSDLDSVGKVGKKKRKRETSKGVPDESASCEDITLITETGERDMKSQNVERFKEFDEGHNKDFIDKVGKKKKKRKKGNEDDAASAATEGILAKKSNPMRADSTVDTEQEKSRGIVNIEGKRKKLVEDGSQDSKSKKKSPKKVSFSPNVEVFPSAANGTEKSKDSLIRGKRFTKEEDELVRQAVYHYIEANCLGEEGLDMVLNCQSEPRVKNCWKEIATCIPYRPYIAIYFRAHILFKRGKDRKWTEEEYKMIREFHNQHGPKWKVLADELGKHMWHVKDTWRRIKLPNLKKGRWDQEELENLFKFVNEDLLLRVKLSEERKTKYGMLRDNISWSAISDRLTTRTLSTCCHKWYDQLSSPMVAEGKWADTDDYRLIDSLYKLDASCIEDVDWDNVVDSRSGDVCLKRWKQMVLHIGQHSTKPFTEQVELLASRYCPDLVDARVAWDNKPLVD